MPVRKELLINVEIGTDISCLSSLRILFGILWGPHDLLIEKEPITFDISCEVVGRKRRECRLGSFIKLLKWLNEGGILSRIESAIVVKKSLKALATVSGSDDKASPSIIEIGGFELSLAEIKSQISEQTLREFLSENQNI